MLIRSPGGARSNVAFIIRGPSAPAIADNRHGAGARDGLQASLRQLAGQRPGIRTAVHRRPAGRTGGLMHSLERRLLELATSAGGTLYPDG